jgi:hypothetical protein
MPFLLDAGSRFPRAGVYGECEAGAVPVATRSLLPPLPRRSKLLTEADHRLPRLGALTNEQSSCRVHGANWQKDSKAS